MERKIHKPGCMANLSCLVYHPDGVCPGPYGKCTCDEIKVMPEATMGHGELMPKDGIKSSILMPKITPDLRTQLKELCSSSADLDGHLDDVLFILFQSQEEARKEGRKEMFAEMIDKLIEAYPNSAEELRKLKALSTSSEESNLLNNEKEGK